MPIFSVIQGRDPMLSVELHPGETVIAESNAMVMMDSGAALEGHMKGGLFASLGRNLFSNESFFQQQIRASKGKPGYVLLAPQLPGDIEIVEVGESQYFLNSGSFMASDDGVRISQKVNRNLLGAFFGQTGGLVIMRTEGQGKLCLSGFGQIMSVNITPDEPITIDNGHVVAWDANLNYEVASASSKRGIFGRMISTAMSGEYLVTKFSGTGKVFFCSRNLTSFEGYIRALIPPQNARS